MYGNQVGLGNYQTSGGYSFDYNQGFGDGQNTQELMKAMQAGQITGRDTADQSLTVEPLKVESLEQALKQLTFRTKDIRFWNAIPKLPAYNTVEEFLQLESYGTERGGFYNEGELSDVEDSAYVRRSELVKYIQVTGEVTLQAQMVNTYIGDVYQREVTNKMMWVLRTVNTALTKADSDIIPQEFNGLYKQHQNIGTNGTYSTLDDYFGSEVVIDLRGDSLKQEKLEDGAIAIDDNFGSVSDLFGPPSVVSGLSKDTYSRSRFIHTAGQPQGYIGAQGNVLESIDTTVGKVTLNTDKFMGFTNGENKVKQEGTNSFNQTSQKAPNKPTGLSAAVVAGEGNYTADNAGDYYYAVTALNRFGESAPVALSSAVSPTATDAVDLSFSDGGGATPATGYAIYKTEATTAGNNSGLKFYPLFKVSKSEYQNGYDGASANTVRDKNRFMANTEQALLMENSIDVYSFKQLAPMSKLDLAVLGPAYRFMVFLFGTPQLYTPKKMVRFINIGAYQGEP